MSNQQDLCNYLTSFISVERKKKFDEIIGKRTRHITVVLEDIYQPHNASAVLRSCDCFGVQDVHIIENKNQYTVNDEIALGSSKWLSLYKYSTVTSCINQLKTKGYKIIATTPHKNDTTIHELDINQKTALLFGTELKGISEDVLEQADGFVKIPMFGFTESFNISVSVALCLHTLVHKLHKENIFKQLSEFEKGEVMLNWLRNSISKPELIEAEYNKKKKLQ